MKNLTIVRKKERFVERPLWICTFYTEEGKEELVGTSLRQLSEMLREKGIMK